jgi:hypothetical protein
MTDKDTAIVQIDRDAYNALQPVYRTMADGLIKLNKAEIKEPATVKA